MIRRAAAAVTAAGLFLVAGCGSGGDDDNATHTLTVFAAASLTDAFTDLAEDFESSHPGVRVRLSFDGSSGLFDQIAGGAPADVFASADLTSMDRAIAAGLVAGEPASDAPTIFATNQLRLITPPGNPAGITGLDSSLDGTRLVICAELVPCGAATRTVSERAGVELRPVSEETKVTDVRGKVTSGEADAGIVYVTDARAAAGAVDEVPLVGADSALNEYPIAVLRRAGAGGSATARSSHGGAGVEGASTQTLAQEFVDTVTGPLGRTVLESYGFGPP